MKNLITFLFCFLSLSAFSQGLKLNFMTTNLTMVTLPSEGFVPIWNDTAKRWSNGVIAATATNAQPPSTILTNISQTGAITNIAAHYGVAVNTIGGITTLSNSAAIYTNTIYVNAIGAPLLNGMRLTNAIGSAPRGTRVFVGPGDYYDGTNTVSLAKDGVSVHFEKGARYRVGSLAYGETFTSPFYDDGNAITSTITGFGEFIITNTSGILVYASTAGTRIFFECFSATAMGTNAAIIGHDGGSVFYWAWDETRTSFYDVYLAQAAPTATSEIFYYSRRTYTADNWIEVPGGYAKGKAYFHSPYVEATSDTAKLSFMNVTDYMVVDGGGNGVIVMNRSAVISGGATTEPSGGFGVIRGYEIYAKPDSTNSVVQRTDSQFNTSFRLEDCIIHGPTNRDPIDIVITGTNAFTIAGGDIIAGFAATNSIRAAAAESVNVVRPFNANLPKHANITFVGTGTNYMGGSTVIGGNITLGGDIAVNGVINGNSAVISDIQITGSLTADSTNVIAAQAVDGSPSAGDTILVHDVNTASLKQVAISSLPAGGSVGPGSLAFNLNQFDTNATVSLKNGALGTNLSARGLNLPHLTSTGIGYVDASGNFTNLSTFTFTAATPRMDIGSAYINGSLARVGAASAGTDGASNFKLRAGGVDLFDVTTEGDFTPSLGNGVTQSVGTASAPLESVTAYGFQSLPVAGRSLGSGRILVSGYTNNVYVSASTNVMLVFSNLVSGVPYNVTVSNGANVVITMSNAAAIKVANLPAGQFPSFNTNGFTFLTVMLDSVSGATNLVSFNSSENSLVAGWKLGMETNAAIQTVTLNVTNAQTLIASNQTSVQVDFSAGTPDYYSTDVMRANLSVQPTNLVVGRTATVYLTGDTNANERTVTVITNGIAGGAAIRWFFNTPTNGATSFTVTNTQRAELSLKVLSATEIWAAWSPVR